VIKPKVTKPKVTKPELRSITEYYPFMDLNLVELKA
jgi:hypothetical protein